MMFRRRIGNYLQDNIQMCQDGYVGIYSGEANQA